MVQIKFSVVLFILAAVVGRSLSAEIPSLGDARNSQIKEWVKDVPANSTPNLPSSQPASASEKRHRAPNQRYSSPSVEIEDDRTAVKSQLPASQKHISSIRNLRQALAKERDTRAANLLAIKKRAARAAKFAAMKAKVESTRSNKRG